MMFWFGLGLKFRKITEMNKFTYLLEYNPQGMLLFVILILTRVGDNKIWGHVLWEVSCGTVILLIKANRLTFETNQCKQTKKGWNPLIKWRNLNKMFWMNDCWIFAPKWTKQVLEEKPIPPQPHAPQRQSGVCFIVQKVMVIAPNLSTKLYVILTFPF